MSKRKSQSIPLHVLLIEDNPGDARLIEEQIKEAQRPPHRTINLESVQRLSEGLLRVAQGKIDAVLLDLSLPDSQGLDTLTRMFSEAAGVPILVLTGLNDEVVGLEAVQRGAQDYIIKGFMDGDSLVRAIRYAIGRKVTEDALRQYAISQATLLNQLMNAQETERHRLSMDIHDGPLQTLGVSLMTLDRAIRRFESGQQERALQELQELKSNLKEMVSEIRSVLADLGLDSLTTYGLESALNTYITRFKEAVDINVELTIPAGTQFPPETELLLYRLVQEALANVRKHAGAHNVVVLIKNTDDEVDLTVSDDGVGFDIADALKKAGDGHGLGLKSMRQRAVAAGGDLEITSTPGTGTTLTFRCPLFKKE